MPDSNDRNLVPQKGGFFQDITNRVRLIGQLIIDPRVSPIAKILPVGALLYAIFPDILPMNPIDDAVVLWAGTYLFVELCPPEVVAEHLRRFTRGWDPSAEDGKPKADEDVVEGEFYEAGQPPHEPRRS